MNQNLFQAGKSQPLAFHFLLEKRLFQQHQGFCKFLCSWYLQRSLLKNRLWGISFISVVTSPVLCTTLLSFFFGSGKQHPVGSWGTRKAASQHRLYLGQVRFLWWWVSCAHHAGALPFLIWTFVGLNAHFQTVLRPCSCLREQISYHYQLELLVTNFFKKN